MYPEQARRIGLDYAGCLECGTCRLVCDSDNVDWNYPRGGFGILLDDLVAAFCTLLVIALWRAG